MRNSINIESLIARSFSEEISDDERNQLKKWIDESDSNKSHYIQLLSIWQSSHPPFDIHSINEINAEKQIMSKISSGAIANSSFIVWIQRVAAVLIFPLLSLTVYLLAHYNQSDRIVFQEIKTPFGIVSKVSLPDSSFVWLNAGSTLKYPTVFNKNERRVFLTGEGYFEVHADKKHPFVVETNAMDVCATGTHFNVEVYPNDTTVAVTLVEGKVDVKFENKYNEKLMPDQRIVYSTSSHKYNVTKTNAQEWTLWKDGKLVFRDEPLDIVFKRLSRAFNVDISVKDPNIAKQSYRATFDGESLDEIFRLLKFTAPLRYERTGKIKLKDGTYNKEKISVYMSE